MSTRTKKYQIDEWVIYQPIPVATPKRAVILWTFNDNRILWDYEIFIDGEGKIIKVLEGSLFPI